MPRQEGDDSAINIKIDAGAGRRQRWTPLTSMMLWHKLTLVFYLFTRKIILFFAGGGCVAEVGRMWGSKISYPLILLPPVTLYWEGGGWFSSHSLSPSLISIPLSLIYLPFFSVFYCLSFSLVFALLSLYHFSSFDQRMGYDYKERK